MLISLYFTFNPFFMVCGMPRSGKTTLMKLLHAHILLRDPGAVIEVLTSWPEESGYGFKKRRKQRIRTFPFDGIHNNYLLFDNAQSTYWDGSLWEEFFKDTV
jgi:hypothetical protein